MRIYLKEPRSVTETTKAGVEQQRSYPKPGFYNAPDDLAETWIDEGIALEATDDNKVNGFRRGSDVAELVDLDAGESIEDLFSTPQIAPPEPEDAGEPVEVDVVDDLDETDDGEDF